MLKYLTGAPDAPYDCRVSNETAQSLNIDCIPGFDRGLKQTFHLELYDSVDENLVANMTNAIKPTFKAIGLVPSMSYVVVVYASNMKGRSNSLLLVSSTLNALGAKDGMKCPLFIEIFKVIVFEVIGMNKNNTSIKYGV